jgi:competence protein ComEA
VGGPSRERLTGQRAAFPGDPENSLLKREVAIMSGSRGLSTWLLVLVLSLSLVSVALAKSPEAPPKATTGVTKPKATAPTPAKPAKDTKAAKAAKATKPVNINKADAKELALLQGVGPALAKRIVDFRKKHGPFAKPEDLKKVKGIGDKILEKNKALIRVK